MAIEFNPRIYEADRDAYLDSDIRDVLDNLQLREEGSSEHAQNVKDLIDEVDAVHPGDFNRADIAVNRALALARDGYAKAVAERGSGIWGVGFHNLKPHLTKRTLRKAEYTYRVALDAAGASAIRVLEDAGYITASGPDRADKIRGFGIYGMLLGTTPSHGGKKGEAQVLAEAVETHRLLKVGDRKRDDSAASGYEDVTKGWKHGYNTVAATWTLLGRRKKIIAGVVIGAGATAAIIAMGPAAPVAAVAVASVAGSRAALTARWSTRTGMRKEAAYQTSASINRMRKDHDNSTAPTANTVIKPTSKEAHKRNRHNTRLTTIAVGLAALSAYFGHDIQHGVDWALDHTRHGIDVLEHDVFGPHHHAETSPRPATSAPGTSRQSGHQPGTGPVEHVTEITPNSSTTVYGDFAAAHVNVHDWYNAMDAAEHAGVLDQHEIGGNPNIFYLSTANGSTSHASVIDTIMNYMAKGRYEDNVTHHVSGSALSAHNANTYGGVTPFADQVHHTADPAVSHAYPAHVEPLSAYQENQIVGQLHSQGAEAFHQGAKEYAAFAAEHGGTTQYNAEAYYAGLNTALAQHKLEIGLNEATDRYVLLSPGAYGHWDLASMDYIQHILREEATQDGYKLAA